jgi:nitrile hydratase subunit alpha
MADSPRDPREPSDTPDKIDNQARRSFLRNTGLAALAAGASALPQVKAKPNGDESANAVESPAEGAGMGNDLEAMGGSPVVESGYSSGEQALPSLKQRVLALKGLLVKKGVLTEEKITGFVAYYEKLIGPHLGAAAVAHAWVNPEFRQKLIAPPPDKPFMATEALRDFFFKTINPDTGRPFLSPELTIGTAIGPEGEYLRILENGMQTTGTDKGKKIHNIVACTVCSCYPQALLGVQPTWYKSQQYRSRVMSTPLGVVDEFVEDLVAGDRSKWAYYKAYRDGLDEIRTWDSNSEVRFFVIPEMPEKWKNLSEQELCKRVTRNAMLGAEILFP